MTRARMLRLLLPAGLLAVVLLQRFGVIRADGLVWGFILAEAALSIYVLVTLVRTVRAARRLHGQEGALYPAAVAALSQVLPGRVAAFAAMEPFLYWDLLRWLSRRRPQEAGTAFPHALGQSWGPILAITWMLTPVELFLVELLLPWAWLRVLLLIGGVWGVLYITGVYASVRLRPHLLLPDGLRLRYGLFYDADIPFSAIQQVGPVRGIHPPRRSWGQGWGLAHGDNGAAFLPGADDPNIALTLGPPVPLANVGDEQRVVSTLYLRVGDARGFVSGVAGLVKVGPV